MYSMIDSPEYEFHIDPYHKRYLACINKVDSKEIVDGYTVEELGQLIDNLTMIRSRLQRENENLHTPFFYTGVVE